MTVSQRFGLATRFTRRIFKEETSAKHIVFAYSLFKAVGNKKLELVSKQNDGIDLTRTETEQLSFLKRRARSYSFVLRSLTA